MGEAKRRGSLEMRVALAVQKAAVEAEIERQKKANWWNSLTYEQKQVIARRISVQQPNQQYKGE